MANKISDKCPEGLEQRSIYISPEEDQLVRRIQKAQERTLGYPPPLHAIRRQLQNFALRYMNMATGELPALLEQDIDPRPLSPTSTFADDDELKIQMDQWPCMSWAARLNNESIHANLELTRFTGHSAEEFAVLGWLNVLHPDDKIRVCRICRDGFRTRARFDFVYRLRQAEGLYGWIHDYAQPFYRSNRRIAGYVGFMALIATEPDFSAPEESVLSLQAES